MSVSSDIQDAIGTLTPAPMVVESGIVSGGQPRAFCIPADTTPFDLERADHYREVVADYTVYSDRGRGNLCPPGPVVDAG